MATNDAPLNVAASRGLSLALGQAQTPQNVIFEDNFDSQADYTVESLGANGGYVKESATLPAGWDGVFKGTQWSPENGDVGNHGSFEISALNARGGSGKAITHYRESFTQRVYSPQDGQVVLPSDVTHIRLWMSTSEQFSTAKSATATVNGTDYTFTATTAADGGSPDTTPFELEDITLGTIDIQFNAVTNQQVHRGIVSNGIAVPQGATVSVTGGDIQPYTDKWKARTDQFVSDSQLIKAPIDPNNTAGTDELYVEFWIKFAPEWYQRGFYEGGWASKIFRAASYTVGGNMFSGGQRDLGPMFYWDYKADAFGVRNSLTLRGGPPANLTTEDNYNPNPNPYDIFAGSRTYQANDIAGMEVGGTDPQLPDLVNGGLLADNTGIVYHESVFGPAEKWTKMAFYLKMNSAPGAEDGVLSQFVDGHRITHFTTIPWCDSNTENIITKWNHFSIGGNDNFHPFPNADKYEDWYVIDDVKVLDHLPETFI